MNTKPLLTITVVGYEYASEWAQMIACLQLQTDPRWRCQLINDGPDPQARRFVQEMTEHDARFHYMETPERVNDWGHSLRRIGLAKTTTEFWCTQNADNYLTPVFVEYTLAALADADVVIFPCVHSYEHVNGRGTPPYSVLQVGLRRNRCDAGSIVLRTDLALQVGWRSLDKNSDGDFVEDLRHHEPRPRLVTLPNVLMVHN